MQTIVQALYKLRRSPFRAQFHLSREEKDYVRAYGLERIRSHCVDIIKRNIAPAHLQSDGRQTPMHGHPVFVAQHATAVCCRQCLRKWYRVPTGYALNEEQQERLVNFLMAWIELEMNTGRCDNYPIEYPIKKKKGKI